MQQGGGGDDDGDDGRWRDLAILVGGPSVSWAGKILPTNEIEQRAAWELAGRARFVLRVTCYVAMDLDASGAAIKARDAGTKAANLAARRRAASKPFDLINKRAWAPDMAAHCWPTQVVLPHQPGDGRQGPQFVLAGPARPLQPGRRFQRAMAS